MATVQTIINRAMRMIDQLNPGTSADATESADALEALNAMYGKWRNEGLMCYAMQDQSIPLVAGNQTRTIGPTGNLVTTRPVDIKTAYVVVDSTQSYPVEMITAEEYAMIFQKGLTNAWPYKAWYQPNMPDGTIYFWPVPSASSTFHVIDETPLTAFSSVSDAISAPPGMEDAMAFNLAVVIAPEYGGEASQTVKDMAKATLKVLKRTNNKTPRMYFDPTLYGNRYVNGLYGYGYIP